MKTEYPNVTIVDSIALLQSETFANKISELICDDGIPSPLEAMCIAFHHVAEIAKQRFLNSEDVREFLAQIVDLS